MFTLFCTYLLLISVNGRVVDRPSKLSQPQRYIPIQRRTTVSGWTSLACAVDNTTRALVGSSYSASDITVESCISRCTSQKYTIAGLEAGNQCFCGNAVTSGMGANTTGCTIPCVGNKTEMCGGVWRINLYKAPVASSSSVVAKTTTSTTTILSTVKSTTSTTSLKSTTTTSAAKSTTTTATSKSTTSTTTAKSTSTMSTTIAKSSTTTSSASKIATTTTSVAPTATAIYTSLGCRTDSSTRALTGLMFSSGTLTVQSCISRCSAGNFTYAGMEAGSQCFCGNTLTSGVGLPTTGCTMPCAGDATQLCGGSYKLNVWASGVVIPSSTTSIASTTANSASTMKSTTTANSTTTLPSASANSTGPCNAACTSVIGQAAPPAATGAKALYVHHMIGNTYSYTSDTWADDISQAQGAGIDGFALNFGFTYGSGSWEPAQLDAAYSTAAASGGFKVFLSLDMTVLPCGSANDASNIAGTIMSVAGYSSQATYKGKVLLGTFSGDSCAFGQSSPLAGWQYLRSLVSSSSNTTLHIVPAVFSDPSTFSSAANAWMDGELNWNSGWPTGGANLDTSSDERYMAGLGNKTYMPAISPAFFTYYGPNSWNKDWIYRGDNWLFASRMEAVIGMRNEVDFAEIISWNDYGESHHIGPIRADQPNSQGWTNGFPHTAWLALTSYYATAFKTGSYPAISTDKLFLWSRPHPAAAIASAPTNPKPSGWQYTDDNLYAVVLLTSPATVTINSGTHTGSWNLPAGLSKLSLASGVGSIGGSVVRSGKVVKSYDSGAAFNYVAVPADYNFNYFTGGSW